MITYTDTLFEKPKESAQHYTSTQQSRFSLQRIIDNQKRYWINHNPSPVLKPKTLLLADWSATAWSERKVLDVINSLSQVLEDGFRIYVWQKGSLVSLTKETLFYHSGVYHMCQGHQSETRVDLQFLAISLERL